MDIIGPLPDDAGLLSAPYGSTKVQERLPPARSFSYRMGYIRPLLGKLKDLNDPLVYMNYYSDGQSGGSTYPDP